MHLISFILGAILVATLAVFYRFYLSYRRVSRDRDNLRISRDRANYDLEMISHHQVKIRAQTNSDDSAFTASLRDSLPDKRCTVASLPPGPPSSSDGQSVAKHEATRSGESDDGAAPTQPAPAKEQIISRTTACVLPSAFPGWPGTAGRAALPKKTPAPAEPSAPRAKINFNSPYNVFRREQQPLLLPGLSMKDREKQLGKLPLQL